VSKAPSTRFRLRYEGDTAVFRFVGAPTWAPSKSVSVPSAGSVDPTSEKMKSTNYIRLVKWVFAGPIALVSIPMRNAIVGRVERSLITDERLLRVDPWVISQASLESERVGGGPSPGERHNDCNHIR
jgi:hypothetical protein